MGFLEPETRFMIDDAGEPAGRLATSSERLPPEIAFLERSVPSGLLGGIAGRAMSAGVTAEAVLLANGHMTADQYYRALAAHLDVPYAEQPLRPASGATVEAVVRTGVCELAPNPGGWQWLIALRGVALRAFVSQLEERRHTIPPLIITSPDRLEALIRHSQRRAVVRTASHGLVDWDRSLSARAGLSLQQAVLLGAAVAATGVVAVADADLCAMILCLAFGMVFVCAVTLRLIATAASRDRPASAHRTPDPELPVYTIIVPLFREAGVVEALVASLDGLDYPRAKLDIILVVEANDRATLHAIDALRLPACYRAIMAPAGRPQTKPRALNVALQFARGALVVVFDAEDRPEPRQLREAAALFSIGPSLACLQARLAIDNFEDNWLTQAFALEYAALFHVINPGLAALGLPIALGGTSNHFRTDVLHRVNGWDAWNVTEDVDLGVRLARLGFRVGSLASMTFEEAPNTVRAWLAQRRRWQKGWMVTLATHTRQPLRTWRDLGTVRTAAVAAMLSGTVFSCLLGPWFAMAVLLRLWSGDLLTPHSPAGVFWSFATLTLVGLGCVSLVWPMLLGLRRRGLMRLVGALGTYPVYLLLLSVAAWQAAIEVCARPYTWAKTEHGRAKRRLTTPQK